MADIPDNLISDYLDGQLNAEQRTLFEEQMRQDPQLRELTAKLKRQSEELRSLPKHSLDAGFADGLMNDSRIDNAFEQIVPQASKAVAAKEFPVQPRKWKYMIGALSALAALLLISVFLILPMSVSNFAAKSETTDKAVVGAKAKSNLQMDDEASEEALPTEEAEFDEMKAADIAMTNEDSDIQKFDDSNQGLAPKTDNNAKRSRAMPEEPAQSLPAASGIAAQRSAQGAAPPAAPNQNMPRLEVTSNVIEFRFKQPTPSLVDFNQSLQRTGIELVAAPDLHQSKSGGGRGGLAAAQPQAFLVEATASQMAALMSDLQPRTSILQGPLRLDLVKKQAETMGLNTEIHAMAAEKVERPDGSLSTTPASAREINLQAAMDLARSATAKSQDRNENDVASEPLRQFVILVHLNSQSESYVAPASGQSER